VKWDLESLRAVCILILGVLFLVTMWVVAFGAYL
jgi:hypothetical protein